MNSFERNQLLDKLANSHASFVLITCDGPDAQGNMEVKMDYEGDPVLASFLLEGASRQLDTQIC